jgi:hypothetical protein
VYASLQVLDLAPLVTHTLRSSAVTSANKVFQSQLRCTQGCSSGAPAKRTRATASLNYSTGPGHCFTVLVNKVFQSQVRPRSMHARLLVRSTGEENTGDGFLELQYWSWTLLYSPGPGHCFTVLVLDTALQYWSIKCFNHKFDHVRCTQGCSSGAPAKRTRTTASLNYSTGPGHCFTVLVNKVFQSQVRPRSMHASLLVRSTGEENTGDGFLERTGNFLPPRILEESLLLLLPLALLVRLGSLRLVLLLSLWVILH